ncbi:MAG TPA: NAD(+) diphosphatase [Stellaceae bacterium]|nr:NAD(+) diphosphatase [Stellaceae bacterium]
MKTPNFYASGPLDRLGNQRKQAQLIDQSVNDPKSRIVALWRGTHLVHLRESGPMPLYLDAAEAAELMISARQVVLLGKGPDDISYVALDLDGPEAPMHLVPGNRGQAASFAELRGFGFTLERDHGAILAYARAILHWHRQHRFCNVCGSPTVSADAGHVRHCTNAECGTHHFPRTDPAVIMLVHDSDRCLLGRQAKWPKGRFSTLAGFVEPGESLEDAVAREVFEETGVRVGDVTYHSSQPWPFPASLMLGFWAEAASTEINVDEHEIETARWFEKGWLLDNRDNPDFALPPADSISRRLIEDWLAL